MSMPASFARSVLSAVALNLVLDVFFSDAGPPVDVPCVHHQADAPAAYDEHRPEEPVWAGHRPDRHEESVDEDIDQDVTAEVAALLELLHRPVARRLLTYVSSHGRSSGYHHDADKWQAALEKDVPEPQNLRLGRLPVYD